MNRHLQKHPTFATAFASVIIATTSIACSKAGSLSDHLFDPSQVAVYFSSNGGMTDVRKAKFAKEMFEKGLPQPWGGRLLYHAIPDGTVFKVDRIYEKVDDGPDAIGISLSLASEDGYGWEYCNTIANLPTTGEYYTHHGSDWPQAPWKKQDSEWRRSFYRTSLGVRDIGSLKMFIHRSKSSESEVEKLNPGSFLISDGWFVGLTVGNDKPQLSRNYMVFPSESDALALAHQDSSSTPATFTIVPPRDKRDVLLAEMVGNKEHFIGLANLLTEAKKRFGDVQPGEALGSIIRDCMGYSHFKSLIDAARGSDKGKFLAELDAAIRKLSELDDRCESATAKRKGLGDFELDLDAARKLERDKNEFRKLRMFNKLWEAGLPSNLYKDYIRCAFQAFPDGVSFAVENVKEGRRYWTVELEAVVYDKVPRIWLKTGKGKTPWTEDKRQDSFFWGYIGDRFADREYFVLRLPKSRTEVEDWEPGKIITSDGWIRETLLENSITTKRQNGREWKENTRKVYVSYLPFDYGRTVLYTSLKDRLDMEKASAN